jgi:hypothetical protein
VYDEPMLAIDRPQFSAGFVSRIVGVTAERAKNSLPHRRTLPQSLSEWPQHPLQRESRHEANGRARVSGRRPKRPTITAGIAVSAAVLDVSLRTAHNVMVGLLGRSRANLHWRSVPDP